MRMLRNVAWVLGLANVLPLQLANAQNRSLARARRWELTATFGGTSGRAGQQLMGRMAASGLDDPSACWFFCSGAISHPFHEPGGLATNLGLTYSLREPWGLKLERIRGDLGETFGYKNPSSWMFLRSAVETYAVSAVLSGGWCRLAVGPALHSVAVSRTDMPGGPPSRGMRLGAVVEAAVIWPSRSRLFLEVVAQRAFVGSVNVGPFTTASSWDSTITTVPRTPVSFSYSGVRLGLGLRL